MRTTLLEMRAMNLNDIKAIWAGYSPRKKWLIGGIAVLVCLGSVNAGQRVGLSDYADASRDRQGNSERTGNGGPTYAAGGQYQMEQTQSGGSVVSSSPSDTTSGWERNQAVQDRAATAFSQNMRDQSTIRDTGTGEVTSEVPNEVADPAVAIGAATTVPTAELPASGDGQ